MSEDPAAHAHQNILEFWRRNCNKRKIAEGIRPRGGYGLHPREMIAEIRDKGQLDDPPIPLSMAPPSPPDPSRAAPSVPLVPWHANIREINADIASLKNACNLQNSCGGVILWSTG